MSLYDRDYYREEVTKKIQDLEKYGTDQQRRRLKGLDEEEAALNFKKRYKKEIKRKITNRNGKEKYISIFIWIILIISVLVIYNLLSF